MLFQMPLYSQSNASFVDLMFFSWVIILLFCNASLLQVKLVLFLLFLFRTKLDCLCFSKCLCTPTKKRFCCCFFFFSDLSSRLCQGVVVFFLRCLFGLRCRLSFLWIPLPTSSADLCFSTCWFQLLCSLPTSLLSLLFCESLPILLFRLSSFDSRLRNVSSDFLFDFRPCGFDFWLLISDFSSYFSLCFLSTGLCRFV